jgi:hypothetical protein
MSKVIKGYIWKMRMLLQKAQRKARRSSLVFLGDSKSKTGIIFSRLILEGEINDVDVIGSSGV